MIKDLGGLLQLLDTTSDGRVLVYGTPPPLGHDLDLIAPARQHTSLVSALRRNGFARRGHTWLSAEPGITPVDLVPAERWGLPPGQVDALFRCSLPAWSTEHIRRPAPQHALLIAARRLGGGSVPPGVRRLVDEAVGQDPAAWCCAGADAAAWHVTRRLALLRSDRDGSVRIGQRAAARLEAAGQRLRNAARRSRLRSRGRSPRRIVIGLSGVDGAGKSMQAACLVDALQQRGIPAASVWTPGRNLQFRVPERGKSRLRRLLHTNDAAAEGGARGPRPLLATLAAVAQVVALRTSVNGQQRGVVVLDRSVLDAVVYIRHRWGAGQRLVLQSWLVRTLAPKPTRAFLLEIRPEVALARKRDHTLADLRARAGLYDSLAGELDVQVVDAERPAAAVGDDILRSVLNALEVSPHE